VVQISLTKFDEILLTEAQKGTALARERASAAYERASENEKETADTLKQAEQERADAAKALEAAEVARKSAEGFQSQIAQANERAAEAKLELAKFKAPRELSIDQQQRIISKCKTFPGTPFIFLVNPTPEAVSFLAVIEEILVSSCGWSEQSDDVFGFVIPTPKGHKVRMQWGMSGIGVYFSPERTSDLGPPAKALADAFTAEGVSAGAATNPTANTKAIYILVGQKP
jgi:hypothetical protein